MQRPRKIVRRITVRHPAAEQPADLIRAGRGHRRHEHAHVRQSVTKRRINGAAAITSPADTACTHITSRGADA